MSLFNITKMVHNLSGRNIKKEMNGIFALAIRSFPVPFPLFLELLSSYHIPKKMDSVPERELFFPFLNMYGLFHSISSKKP